jgi:tRNA 2-thiouridine synthesizing protein B
MILHTLNAAPSASAFSTCLDTACEGDAILLLGDGVYGAIAGSAACERLAESGAALYLLRCDAEAAGLLDRVDAGALIGMEEFVALTEHYPRQLAWY